MPSFYSKTMCCGRGCAKSSKQIYRPRKTKKVVTQHIFKIDTAHKSLQTIDVLIIISRNMNGWMTRKVWINVWIKHTKVYWLHTHYLLLLIWNIILLTNLAKFGSLVIKFIQLVLVFYVDSYGIKLLLLLLLKFE